MCKLHNSGASSAINVHRLRRNVLPDSYQVRLEPDLKAGTFTGEVTIQVKVLTPTDTIALNALTWEDPKTRTQRAIEVTEASISRENGTAFTGTIIEEPEAERVLIKVKGVIGVGEWEIKARFTGVLNDKLKGFYRSTYTDAAGVEQVIATTQFESTDARRAFPCFDEPDMKATFQITLVVDPELQAVSNESVVYVSLVDGKKVVEFAPTMKMSTYIVAFVVGKLVSSKPLMVDGVECRVWTVPGKEHMTRFALETTQFALRYYRKYFGVPYPGKKLDQLAIPDFASGAMENMGCVTYREEALLLDPATASQAAFDRVSEVVAHELAHMWFGNLVTMRWWNGLWLNEAFATFMSHKCVDAWKPEWGFWDKFGLARAGAYKTDGLKTTRPVEFNVVSPEDANQMFDVLTYEKGCSVMGMLEAYMGADAFQRGIAKYIKRHSYGNTEGADLWKALEEASGLPVADIMHSWIFTPGYPVVSVKVADTAGAVTLSQRNFKYLPQSVDEDQLWVVPVLLRAKTADGIVEVKHLLRDREETIYLGEGVDWVVANAGGHGFYRVLYSTELRDKLTKNEQKNLSVIERVNLVGDTWASVQAGLTNSIEFLNLIKLFPDENDPNVWSAITGPLGTLERLLPLDQRDEWEAFVRSLVGPALARLGYEPIDGETTQIGELRGELFSTLALSGNDEPAQAKARELFARWETDPTSVDGDMVGAVISIVAALGDEEAYDDFYAYFKASTAPEQEQNFLYALAGFQNLDLLKRTLNFCLDPKAIRTQDAPFVIASVMRNEIASADAWQFVQDKWDDIVQLFPPNGVVRLCAAVTSLSTPAMESQVQAFFASREVKEGKKAVSQYLELLRVAVLLRERESAVLADNFVVPAVPTEDAGDKATPETVMPQAGATAATGATA